MKEEDGCWTHLHCLETNCKYNKPKDVEMGMITWCEKYLVDEQDRCDKECARRSFYG